jgi:gamma-glutamylcyclotransferase
LEKLQDRDKKHRSHGSTMIDDRLLYFAYGANLSLDSMTWRCPRAQPLTAFYLRDWRLKLYCHATIEPSPGDCVAGALWSITSECEKNLDIFEGFPVYYDKIMIHQDGVDFMAYTMNQPLEGSPGSSYTRLLEQGYRDWQLPLSWLENDQRTAT